MDVQEALRKADSFIKEAKGKGYFLSSVFSSIKDPDEIISEWILHFSGKAKAVDCYVKDDSLTVEESQSMGEASELDVQNVRVSAAKALELARKGKENPITTLLSLHGSPPLWTINLITAAMTVRTLDIDAKTGDIKREEMTSILRK